MADRHALGSDAARAAALRDLGGAIAYPALRADDPDLARGCGWPSRLGRRPTRPGGAASRTRQSTGPHGVPGIRISLVDGPEPSIAPTVFVRPSLGLRLGSGGGLGRLVPLDEVAEVVGFEPILPATFGRPDATWVSGRRLTLVRATGPGLPGIEVDGAGLLITEFRGRSDADYYTKIAADGTIVERVCVAGRPGYWLTGEAHRFFYVDEDGRHVEETRRFVGDALIWAADWLTFRIESGLGRDATIAIAASLSPTP